MKDQDKQEYLERYAQQKRRGIPFFPDAIFKDVVVAALVIAVIVGLSAVAGTPLEEPAEPNDTTYTPRPEWYFLFLFQFLKYVPGRIEALGVIGVPVLIVGALLALPLIDRSPRRHFRGRMPVLGVTAGALLGMSALTLVGLVDTPPPADVGAIAQGDVLAAGQDVFASSCSICHGQFGEGGPDPVRTGDIIAPISSAQYLGTHGDETIRSIISQGQPSLGMAPFALAFGGPLRESDIDAVLAYVRSWQDNPPVELPPLVAVGSGATTGGELFTDVCAQCHALDGSVGVGPSLVGSAFQTGNTDPEIFDTINLGHPATSMIGWGDVLTARQIESLVGYIRELGGLGTTGEPDRAPTFSADVLPIFEAQCTMCHGAAGGWGATTRQTAIKGGLNGPAVIPGDPDNSLLVQKLLDTQSVGTVMPPGAKLSDEQIAVIVEWIRSGAAE